MKTRSFSDPLVGVSGIQPVGWAAEGLGVWVRPADQALLLQRGIPNITAEQVRTGYLRMFGLPRLESPCGRKRTASLQWELYQQEAQGPDKRTMVVDAALAQVGKWTYLVLLVSDPSTRPELHPGLFQPAVEAVVPAFIGAQAARVAKERAKDYAAAVQHMRDIMKSNLTVESDWVSDQMKGIPMPPTQKSADPAAEVFPLPAPHTALITKPGIRDCIADRKSVRKFTEKDLTLAELSYLLWATQGVRKALPTGRHYRTVPSAGARHSFETYLVIQHVEGLKPGVYRYLPFDHKLVFLFTAEDLPEKMTLLASGQPFVGNCAACFIWSSIPYRMEWRYGFHSERVILMDVGHVCQNLYLAAGSIECGTCGVAAYDQPALDKFLGLDGRDEFVIYLAPVGKLGQEHED